MNPERWQQIEQLYHAAMERAATQRTAYLDEVCANDQELRSAVIALLAADKKAANFLSIPAFELAAKEQAQEIAAEPALLITGQVIGHYRVLSRLGVGGMGEVWLAEDNALRRRVALKLLPLEFTANEDRVRRFQQEARAASALNHPNIITIYEIGESGNLHFIATEFIEGVTLRQRMAAGKFTLHEAIGIAVQSANAIDAAHRADIVHRDIKPENIMLRPDGLVKVLDFGLARITAQPLQDETLVADVRTETGVIMGTPRYMSPEQARGLKTDARTDIFSLGVMLYEMTTGHPPFPGKTTAEVFASLLDKEPTPLSEYLPSAPDELEEIISQALEKDPDARYQTIRDLASDLEHLRPQLTSNSEELPTRQLSASSSAAASLRPSRRSTERHTTLKPATRTTDENLTATTVANKPALYQRRSVWLVGALVLIAGLGFGIYQWFSPNLSRRLAGPPVTIPFTSFPGVKDYACFSPDGNQLAFAWDGAKKELTGKRDIYIKLIGVGEPLRLTSAPEDDLHPAWSPDGRHIAFLRDLGGKYGVYLVPALPGGAERKLTEASSGVSWSQDGKTLAIASLPTPDDSGSILLLNVETNETRRLTTAPPPFREFTPTFSPDGKTVAFVRSYSNSAREIFVVPTSGGTPKQLTSDKRPIFGLTWTADSRELVFSANRGGGRGLWRLSASGGTPERIVVTGHNPSFPAISRQGNRLAYTDSYSDSNLYLYEGAGFGGRFVPGKFGEPSPILTSTREDTSPQFSPDGTKLVFTSQRNGSEELFAADSQGGQSRQLTFFDGPNAGTPHWSPDGRWIAFDSRAKGSPDIYVISAEGGQARQLTTELAFDSQPSWSHDGHWIYFTSDRSRRGEIWKLPAEGGQAIQLTHGGAFEGYEAPDGKLFYFTKNRGVYGIWSVPVEGGEEKPVPELSQAGYWRSWGVVAQGIYFISKETGSRQSVRFFSFTTRQVTPLLSVEKDALWWEAGLALSPDGRKLIYAQLDHSFNDILLMENFR